MKSDSGNSNTNEPTSAELHENLWEAYFKRFNLPNPSDQLARHVTAIEQLHVLREFSKTAAAREEDKLWGATVALELWSLMAAEIGEWIIRDLEQAGVPLPDIDDPPDLERLKLKGMLSLHEATRGPPQHRKSLDPSCIFLPRWLALRLVEDLDALDQGEVRPLFQPVETGRHSGAKAWDDMRHRALEHVAFLVGQGVGKGIAQKRVGTMMKGVSVNTLKDWEKDARPLTAVQWQIELANKAGKLSILLQNDPGYAKAGSMDAHEAAKLDELSKEDLATFGARYAAKYGHRHNPS